MKTTLAIVAAILFMILAACGEPDYIQVNEPETADAGAPAKHDLPFPEPDAGQTKKDGGEQTDGGDDQRTDTDTTSPCKIVLYFPDADGDGYGNAMMGILADCEGSYHPGWATEAGDCRDSNPEVYPGAPEICNNRDDDCNMIVDDKCTTDCAYKADGTLAKNQGTDDCAQATDFGVCSGNWICLNGELNCSAPEATRELCDGIDNNCDGQVDEGCGQPELPTLLVSLNPGSPSGMAPSGVGVHVLKFNLQSTGDNIVIQGFMLEFHGCALGSETQLYRIDNFLQFGDTEVAGWDTIFETQSFLTATTAPASMLVVLDTSACQSNETVQATITGIVTATTSYPVNGVPLTGHIITF